MTRVIALVLLITSSCNNHRLKNENEDLSWNLLGGSHLKTGEMKSWDDYWVEAYIDTLTGQNKILLVNKDTRKTVSDSLTIGTLPEDMVLDYGTLRVDDKWDPEIVAVFVVKDTSKINHIAKAWRGNSQTGKFESIPTSGITRGNARE